MYFAALVPAGVPDSGTRTREVAWQEHPCDSKSSRRMRRVFLARETRAWGVSGFQSNLWGSLGQAAAICRASPSPPLPSCGEEPASLPALPRERCSWLREGARGGRRGCRKAVLAITQKRQKCRNSHVERKVNTDVPGQKKWITQRSP